MFMAISMLLISCHMNAPIDNIDVITPTNDSNDDDKNDTIDETDTTDDLNDDNKNDNTDETINYFELEDDEILNSFAYKVNRDGEYNATLNYVTSYHLAYGNSRQIIDIELRNTKVIFT